MSARGEPSAHQRGGWLLASLPLARQSRGRECSHAFASDPAEAVVGGGLELAPAAEQGYLQPSDFTTSKPAFDLARHDIWYTDGPTGFYVVHVDDSVWPSASSSRSCSSSRRFVVRLRLPHGVRVRSIRATLGGNAQAVKRRGGTVVAVVNLRGLPPTVRLVIRVRLSDGRTITSRHTYQACSTKHARRSGTTHAPRHAPPKSPSFTG